ncbi:MAG: DEAD/DEAH box helicase [Myxococcota bacterium]
MDGFSPATRDWFQASFAAPTPVQEQGWPKIASGEHSVLIAPTGSGKTLAAFLWCIDRLTREGPGKPGVKVLYVSPLKALVYDVERNLRAPLVGIARTAELRGHRIYVPRVAIRTGDTPARARQQQARDPADILVTTPESLYLLLTSDPRKTLETVQTIIVDEVHALAPSKRGAHLALSLERLTHLVRYGQHDPGPGGRSEPRADEPQRIGLSATAHPIEEVAQFLGGDRDVTLVDTSQPPDVDLKIVVPVPDMTRPMEGLEFVMPLDEPDATTETRPELTVVPDPPELEEEPDPFDAGPSEGRVFAERYQARVRARWQERSGTKAAGADERPTAQIVGLAPAPAGESPEHSIWPAVYPRLLDLIADHRTTIVFVNSRGLCERLAQRLNELAGEDLTRAHHGSISHKQREQIEEMLKGGLIRCIVATSSLELGIDMGTVDLVVLVESPGAVARGLQRVGRAGHGVGETSIGRIFPKHRGDLLEAAVVAKRMRGGLIEALAYPRNPLDVLAQQIVAMCSIEPWTLADLRSVVLRAANFRELPDDAFTGVLDMICGRYPSHAFADLRPRVTWDRDDDVLTTRRGSKMLAIISGGTIPNRGTYAMVLGEDGPRVGELDEEMVNESLPGQNIMLGASTWRIEHITRDRVIVSPAPGEPGRLPFWRGDGPGRPIELGRAMGQFLRELSGRTTEEGEAWLQRDYDLDPLAAKNLVAYVAEQRDAAGSLPTDKNVTIERFRDELGDWRICILTPLGARVHAPWALAIQTKLESHFGFEVQALWSDDGIVLRLVEVEDLPELELLVPDPEEVEELVVQQLAHSALFSGQFRENAARSLLLPRRRAHERQPLWAQRLKSQQLLAVAREFPSFPIIIETYRSCLKDIFDLPALVEVLHAVRRRNVRVDVVETPSPSPFARSLVFAYVATYLYEGDAPLAERKAQALALDRRLLRELLGQEELRELLDATVIDTLESELQGLADDRRARHPDALHDLLRRVGDLDDDEVVVRCDGDAMVWLTELERQRRVIVMRVAGEPRRVAVEDVATYRDGLGCLPPPAVPLPLLDPVDGALDQLVARYGVTHGPFLAGDVARRFGVPTARVEEALGRLQAKDAMLHGEFRPGGREREWCDPTILRRIKRRTLAKLRNEIAPVDPGALGRFLPEWHGIGDERRGLQRLEEIVVQLEGLAISFQELIKVILPSRMPDFATAMLDELGAMGWLTWVGRGALGKTDGRIALYRRERAGQVLQPPVIPDDAEVDPIHETVLAHLRKRGACFFVELQRACGPDARVAEVRDAVWDLVWWGMVTNDTFGAVRSYGVSAKPRRAGRGRGSAPGAGGRWSLVEELVDPEATAKQRAHARAVTLLERHGVVTREAAGMEELPGGFSAVYPVLRAMEEAGKIRRGYFVAGLGGAQFASPGAVDRLRGSRESEDGSKQTIVLSAVDPANPYGWLLPWPDREAAEGNPRRVAGASVVLVEGEAVLFLDKGGKRMLTFPAADDPERFLEAALALRSVAARQRGKLLRVEKIDGTPARTSPRAEQLRKADFASDLRGLTLEVR